MPMQVKAIIDKYFLNLVFRIRSPPGTSQATVLNKIAETMRLRSA